MPTSDTGLDPMTLMMLMKASQPQQQQQPQYAGGNNGQVYQAPQASALASGMNAAGSALQQAMLIKALKQKIQQPVGAGNAAPGDGLGMPGVQAPQNPAVDLKEGM